MTDERPRRALVTLSGHEALALAATATVGRLAHVHDGQVFVTPVNFLLDGQDVLLSTAEGTELLAAARAATAAALEVDDLVNWSRSGWSVLIRGQLVEVTDHAEQSTPLPAGALHPWAGGERRHVLRLVGAEVTGRRIEPGPGGVTVIPG